MNRSTAWRPLVVLAAASLALGACTKGSTGAASTGGDGGNGGPLILGTLLPQTGSLAFLGPPEFAGVALAIQEINANGGVLGKPVRELKGDSGDSTTNIASATVDRLLKANVDAIIGAASSSVSLTVIDKITGAGVVQFSPANTSIALSTYPDNGLYFRTAPPDLFQGAVLGNLVAADGNLTAGVLAVQDVYGIGLATTFEKNYAAHGGQVLQKVIYDPKATDYSAEVATIAAAHPKAVVLIGFDESKKILKAMIAQGIGPDNVHVYLVDGNLSNGIADGLPAGIMNGVKGTTPGAQVSAAFQAQLLAIDPSLTRVGFSYAPEAYDAVTLIALAAIEAKSVTGKDIAAHLVDVSKDGTTCTSFKECAALLKAGEDIDYDGVSGPVDFSANGDPTKATMGIYEFGANNTIGPVATQYISGEAPWALTGAVAP